LRTEPPFKGELEKAFSSAIDTGRGTIGVSVCVRGTAADLANLPRTPARWATSTDGGVSFTRLGDLPRGRS
jgi:hypothetical protein